MPELIMVEGRMDPMIKPEVSFAINLLDSSDNISEKNGAKLEHISIKNDVCYLLVYRKRDPI